MITRVDLGEVEYEEAMKLMAGWVADRRAGIAGELEACSPPPRYGSGCARPGELGACSPPSNCGSGCARTEELGACSPPPKPGSGCARPGDRLFLLSHPPVITYGPRTAAEDLPSGLGIPTIAVDRGGFATYHGPGQLIGYLVINVRERGPGDVVRWLENGIIAALAQLGFPAIRRETPPGSTSLVGVWTPAPGSATDHHKIASIGMRIRHGITSHGFALNIDPDMTAFDQFTVCGLHDVTMTSLRRVAAERGVPMPTEAQVRDALAATLLR